MQRFLYFLPDVAALTRRTLADVGLADRFSAAPGSAELLECSAVAIASPAGMLLAIGGRPPEFQPERQRFSKSENGKFWVGIEDRRLPPGPDDLVRQVGLAGYEITLANGQAWRVPLVRRWNPDRLEHEPVLPRSLARDAAGHLVQRVTPAYRELDAIAEQIFQWFISDTAVPIERAWVLAVQLLAANYRIGPEEASLLGLLDADSANQVLRAAADIARIEAHSAALAIQGIEISRPAREAEEQPVAAAYCSPEQEPTNNPMIEPEEAHDG